MRVLQSKISPVAVTSLSILSGCASYNQTPESGIDNNLATTNQAISASLNPLNDYAARFIGSWAPWTTRHSSQPPQSLQRVPEHSESAVFGEFSFGDGTRYQKESTLVGYMLDEEQRLFIADENRDGDLSNDIPATWTEEWRPTRDGKGSVGTVTVRAEIAASQALGAPRFTVALFFRHKLTRETYDVEFSIDRYRDYATHGFVKFGERTFTLLIDDGVVTGDFSFSPEEKRSDLTLRIDVNDNGKFEDRGEEFQADEPFTIQGVTYEVLRISKDGRSIEFIPSSRVVPEVQPPPHLRFGSVVPSFEARNHLGEVVRFPEDFAGKVVLLDFWASWCGPCIAEMPYLKRAYEEFHHAGFEIVSVSIDEEKTRQEAMDFASRENLPWAQVYTSGGWNGEIVSRYSPGGIPAGFLVDGSSGKLLGSLDHIRGERLLVTVRQALEFVSTPK